MTPENHMDSYDVQRQAEDPGFLGYGYALTTILRKQIEFSRRTFGPGPRTLGIIDHLREELDEVSAKPDDLSEWIDIAMLALDGAWRHAAYEGRDGSKQRFSDADLFLDEDVARLVAGTYVAKLLKNMARTWPDWRDQSPDKAIQHDRTGERPAEPTAQEVLTALRKAWTEGDHNTTTGLGEAVRLVEGLLG